jgi:hypothetical protein
MTDIVHNAYDVLTPWAEADPISFRGISPRLETLDGKTIGMLRNSKRAALPTLQVLEKRLQERFPTIQFSAFANLKPNETAIAQPDIKDDFEEWVKGVDAVINAFGD